MQEWDWCLGLCELLALSAFQSASLRFFFSLALSCSSLLSFLPLCISFLPWPQRFSPPARALRPILLVSSQPPPLTCDVPPPRALITISILTPPEAYSRDLPARFLASSAIASWIFVSSSALSLLFSSLAAATALRLSGFLLLNLHRGLLFLACILFAALPSEILSEFAIIRHYPR